MNDAIDSDNIKCYNNKYNHGEIMPNEDFVKKLDQLTTQDKQRVLDCLPLSNFAITKRVAAALSSLDFDLHLDVVKKLNELIWILSINHCMDEVWIKEVERRSGLLDQALRI